MLLRNCFALFEDKVMKCVCSNPCFPQMPNTREHTYSIQIHSRARSQVIVTMCVTFSMFLTSELSGQFFVLRVFVVVFLLCLKKISEKYVSIRILPYYSISGSALNPRALRFVAIG